MERLFTPVGAEDVGGWGNGCPFAFFFFFLFFFLNKSGVSRMHLCFGKYLRRLGELEVWGREEADDGDVIERNWVESSSSTKWGRSWRGAWRGAWRVSVRNVAGGAGASVCHSWGLQFGFLDLLIENRERAS